MLINAEGKEVSMPFKRQVPKHLLPEWEAEMATLKEVCCPRSIHNRSVAPMFQVEQRARITSVS